MIGQSWTAVRIESQRVELLLVPGLVQRCASVRHGAPGLASGEWIDLTREHEHAEQRYAFCDGVIVVEPVRRPAASLVEIDAAQALHELRGAWPIEELHPSRRPSLLCKQLTQRCACFKAELSRDPNQFARLVANVFSAAHRALGQAAVA